jgi:hypothetical protein
MKLRRNPVASFQIPATTAPRKKVALFFQVLLRHIPKVESERRLYRFVCAHGLKLSDLQA